MAFHPTSAPMSNPTPKGRPRRVTRLSAAEARQEALYLLRKGRLHEGTKLRNIVRLLSTAGVLPSTTIADLTGISERTMRRYRQTQVLEQIEVPERILPLYPPATRLYALGPIGQMVGEILYNLIPIGYIEATQDHVSHDLLTNLVYYHLYKGVKPLGYTAILYSRYEATIHDYKGKPLLEPDAMIVLEHPTRARQVYLVEYHHEDFGRRTAGKVVKYDNILRDHPEEWQSKWQTPTPPTVLAVWTHKAVGTGYAKYFAEQRTYRAQPLARWLGKPLQSFLNKQTVLLWENLGTATPNEALIG